VINGAKGQKELHHHRIFVIAGEIRAMQLE